MGSGTNRKARMATGSRTARRQGRKALEAGRRKAPKAFLRWREQVAGWKRAARDRA